MAELLEVHEPRGAPVELEQVVATASLTIAGTLTGQQPSAAPTPSGAPELIAMATTVSQGAATHELGGIGPSRLAAGQRNERPRRAIGACDNVRLVTGSRVREQDHHPLLAVRANRGERRGCRLESPARPGPTRRARRAYPGRRPNRRTRSPSSRRAVVRRRQRRRRPSFRRRDTRVPRGLPAPRRRRCRMWRRTGPAGGNERPLRHPRQRLRPHARPWQRPRRRPVAWQWQASVRAPAKRAR